MTGYANRGFRRGAEPNQRAARTRRALAAGIRACAPLEAGGACLLRGVRGGLEKFFAANANPRFQGRNRGSHLSGGPLRIAQLSISAGSQANHARPLPQREFHLATGKRDLPLRLHNGRDVIAKTSNCGLRKLFIQGRGQAFVFELIGLRHMEFERCDFVLTGNSISKAFGVAPDRCCPHKAKPDSSDREATPEAICGRRVARDAAAAEGWGRGCAGGICRGCDPSGRFRQLAGTASAEWEADCIKKRFAAGSACILVPSPFASLTRPGSQEGNRGRRTRMAWRRFSFAWVPCRRTNRTT